MRTQESRDEDTVAIVTALGIFVLVLAMGSAVLSAITLRDPSTSPMFRLTIVVSATVAVTFLVRARRS